MELDFSRIDDAFNRGYNQGYRHGAEFQKQLKEWYLPVVLPKHLESIVILVKPYDKKTLKYCKKNNVQWIKYNGIFLDGETIYNECDTNDSYTKEKYPDMVLFSTKEGLTWDMVSLWTSVEVPEWFFKQEEEKNDI